MCPYFICHVLHEYAKKDPSSDTLAAGCWAGSNQVKGILYPRDKNQQQWLSSVIKTAQMSLQFSWPALHFQNNQSIVSGVNEKFSHSYFSNAETPLEVATFLHQFKPDQVG